MKEGKKDNVLRVKLLKDEIRLNALCSKIPKGQKDPNWQSYVLKLSKILSENKIRPEFRHMAATKLRNALTAKDGGLLQQKYDCRWFSFHPSNRQHIKDNILKSLDVEQCAGTVNPSPAALCVVSIAAAEFPKGQWPDLMNNLIKNIVDASSSEAIKEASFQTISCLCQELGKDGRHILMNNSNAILKAILLGMKNANSEVVTAAVNALENAADLFWSNFQVKAERYQLTQALYEIAEFTDKNVRIALMRCLTSLVSHHHESLIEEIDPTFFDIAVRSLQSDCEELRLNTINFFKELCYIEDELKEKATKAAHGSQDQSEYENRFYTPTSLSYLLPTFMQLLTEFVEGKTAISGIRENETWSKFLGFLKELISCCGRSNVDQCIMAFIKENITNEDWRYRNAALVAFSNIIHDSHENFEPLVLPLIEIMVDDEHMEVRATAALAISEMCTDVLQHDKYQRVLIPALLDGLCDGVQVAAVVCNAIAYLAYAGKWSQPRYFVSVVQLLIDTITRSEADNRLQWEAAYTLHFIVGKNPTKCYFAAHKTSLKINSVLQHLSNNQKCQDYLSILHITLEAFLKRLPTKVARRISFMVMGRLAKLMKSKPNLEMLMGVNLLPLISTLIKTTGYAFKKYTSDFKLYLIAVLRRNKYPNLAAIRILRDLCHVLGPKILPYCKDVVPLLLLNLQDSSINRALKKEILSTITFIVLAVGHDYDKYLEDTLTVLIHVQGRMDNTHTGNQNLHSLIEMHKHLLKPYRAISQVFKDDPKTAFRILRRLEPSLTNIVENIKRTVQPNYMQLEMYLHVCLEVLFHVCCIIDNDMSQLVDSECIVELLSFGTQSSSVQIKSLAALVNKKIATLTTTTMQMSKVKREPPPASIENTPSVLRRGLDFVFMITGYVKRFFRDRK